MSGTAVRLGPWIGGLNTQNVPSTISDEELADLFNMEVDIDGSLVSRPTFVADTVWVSVSNGFTMRLLGFFYGTTGAPYLMLTDGESKTYAYDGTTFTTVATTFAAAAFVQFNHQAWLTSPYESAVAGGHWTPDGGFISDANLPKGNVLLAHKYRLWVAVGRQSSYSSSVQSRLYYSNVLGDDAGLWTATPNFTDINAGDGQAIVGVTVYYNNLLIFRTSSIWTLNYNVSVAGDGQVVLLVPGIGLNSVDTFVSFEDHIYFMFEDRAYQFLNNRVVQINIQVPFTIDTGLSTSNYATPFAVSLLHKRVIFSYYNTMYVYSIRTQTWSRWRLASTTQAIGKIMVADTASGLGYLGYDAVVFAQNSQNRTSTGNETLFRVNERPPASGGESMICTMRTKTYDFEDASVFKRLFWWGVDAIFRGTLSGKAVAVRVGSDIEVTTSYDLAGYDSDRRFVKMNKSFRFRQVYFELSFATEGTTTTLPFRLFGLTVYAKPKTSVSKGIE